MVKLIGERLFKLRKEKKLSLEEMGKILDLTGSAYHKYEKGASTPSYSILIKIADYFHVSLDYLAGRKSDDEELARRISLQYEILKGIERKSLEGPNNILSLTTTLEETLDNYNTNRISEEELNITLNIMNEVSLLSNDLLTLKVKRTNDIKEQTIYMISHANKVCEVIQKDLNELILMLLKN